MGASERITLSQVAFTSSRIATFGPSAIYDDTLGLRQVLLLLRIVATVCHKLSDGHLGRAEELTIHVRYLLLAARTIGLFVG